MAIDAALLPPPLPAPVEPVLDLPSMLASEWVRDRLLTIGATNPRNLQVDLGASEIGQPCPRRLAYRIAGTTAVNMSDPIKSMFGTGFHAVLRDGFIRQQIAGRFLIEHNVTYRDVPGSVDLFDRYRKTLIDWKTTSKARIAQYRRNGLSLEYRVQAAIYAEGLREQGETVDTVALVFIPRDGSLSDIWTAASQPDRSLADEYLDRYFAMRNLIQLGEQTPADMAARPYMCGYCPNHLSGSTNVAIACPGKD